MARVVEISGNDELWEKSMRQNFVEWGGRLSLDQYFTRNRQTHDILIRAGMTLRQFAVTPDVGPNKPQDVEADDVEADDTEHIEILGSCQVLSRPLYCGARCMAQDHCIAYVFVPKQHRRHGYAKMLVDHAVKLFSNEKDQVSLWSDVGAYYERSGFQFAPPLDPGVPQHATVICKKTPESRTDCEWLTLSDMSSIAIEHSRLVTRAVDMRRLDARGTLQFCTVLPNEALYKQLQMQPVLEQQMLGGPVPTKFGARTPNGHGWAAWTYLFGFKMLLVLGISGSADEVADLLAAAVEAAAEFGEGLEVKLFESQLADKEVEVNEVVAALDTHGLDFEFVQRQKTLPMSVGNMIYAFPGGHGVF